MQSWRDRLIALFAKHYPVEDVHKIFCFLGTNYEQALVDQKIRNARHAALPDLRFLGEHDAF